MTSEIYESDGSDGYSIGTYGYLIFFRGDTFSDGGYASRDAAANACDEHMSRLGMRDA